MLATTFALSRITLDAISEAAERARLDVGHAGTYIATHAVTFYSERQGAAAPTMDISFGHAFLIAVHPARLPWPDRPCVSLGRGELEETVLSQGIPYALH